MRLLACSPEDADSVWFWQCVEIPIIGWDDVPSRETIKDVLHRYVPANHGDRTPLQLVAVRTAFELAINTQHAADLAAVFIAAGLKLHEGDNYHTPLLLFLSVFPRIGFVRTRDIRRGLVAWLKILQTAGVDLALYGAQEHRQFLAYRSLESPVPPLLYWHELEPSSFSDEVFHFSISYGPTPEDWTVQLDHMFDQYVGDFWRMPGLLEEHVRAVPGAWIDDDFSL